MDTSPASAAPPVGVHASLSPGQTGRLPDGEQALRPEGITTGAGGVSDGPGPSASGNGELAHLFERARRALASRLQLDPEIAEALSLPRPGWAGALPGQTATAPHGTPGPIGHLAARLAVDDRTRQVIVRVIDTRTGDAVRELSLATLAALAAKIGRVITHGTR